MGGLELLDRAVAAHGGRALWHETVEVSVRARTGGIALPLKLKPRALRSFVARISTKGAWAMIDPYPVPGLRGEFEPGRVRIIDGTGTPIAVRENPREMFRRAGRKFYWDRLDVLYFGGYALWNYINLPFLLLDPAVSLEELEPRQEEGRQLRRLLATFPPGFPTHSEKQVYYFDEKGLLVRHDYTAEVFGSWARAAHYSTIYRNFGGLIYPVKRRVYPRLPVQGRDAREHRHRRDSPAWGPFVKKSCYALPVPLFMAVLISYNMKTMRATRVTALLAAILIMLGTGAPCDAAPKKVVATFLPVYIFALNVAGDRAEVSLLVPPGTDVHEFSLRPLDLKRLYEADLVVVNGAGLERGILGSAVDSAKVADTSRGLELMYPSGKTGPPNPHVWLDPLGAAGQARNISQALSAADPENAAYYESNAKAFAGRLDALHGETASALSGLRGSTLVTYHESFGYFAARYGMDAFSLTGPGAEVPLPGRVRELYDMVRTKDVKAVFRDEQFPSGALEAIASDLGVKLCTLSTIESGRPEAGHYELAMRQNLRNILDCLGGL